jgi:hypothetical protein
MGILVDQRDRESPQNARVLPASEIRGIEHAMKAIAPQGHFAPTAFDESSQSRRFPRVRIQQHMPSGEGAACCVVLEETRESE